MNVRPAIPQSTTPATPAATAPAANTYSDLNGLAALKKNPNSPQAIHALAQQVDALFLQMMLKSMRAAASDTGEQQSNEMGMYQDMFDKQIALSLSQHQDLGLGAQLTRQMAALAAAAKAAEAPAPAATPGATVVPGAATAGAPLPARTTAAPLANPDTTDLSPGDFVNQVFPAIQRAADALGVSSHAMLAQAALETGWGKRMARTADGAPSLNLFGIKADDRWTGAKVSAETVEFSGGVAVQKRASFRAYGSIDASVGDYAQLIGSSPRYRDALAQGADPAAYVQALGRSGYATDPDYANKLNQIMNSATFRQALGTRLAAL